MTWFGPIVRRDAIAAVLGVGVAGLADGAAVEMLDPGLRAGSRLRVLIFGAQIKFRLQIRILRNKE